MRNTPVLDAGSRRPYHAPMATPIISVSSASNSGYHVNTPGKQPAVFLDRDGVFNQTDGFIRTPDDLDAKLLPGAVNAIARLTQHSDAKVILVTNQGGISAGHMTEEQNHAIMERLAERVAEAGGRFDAIYYCPNAKKFSPPAGEVDARKPEAGMFFQAGHDFADKIDLADSYMIGDMTTDIAAGEAATPAMTSILLKTGFGGTDGKVNVTPDRVEENLSTAVDFILTQIGKNPPGV